MAIAGNKRKGFQKHINSVVLMSVAKAFDAFGSHSWQLEEREELFDTIL
jgi:hypothetical protein